MNRPLCMMVCVFIAGIVSQRYGPAVLAGPVIFLLYYFSYLRHEHKALFLNTIIILVVFLSFYCFGFFISKDSDNESFIKTHMKKNERTVSGIIGTVEDIYDNQNGTKVLIHVNYIDDCKIDKYNENIYIYTGQKLVIGDQIKFKNKIQFYDKPHNHGEFDNYSYQTARNIYADSYIDEVSILKKYNTPQYVYKRTIINLRRKYISLANEVFTPKSAGALILMITGCNQYIDRDIKELYQTAGFAHVLSISGLHISIIGLSILNFFRRKKLSYAPSAIFTIVFLMLYNTFSGGHITCERAIISMMFSLTARTLGRNKDSLTGLAVAAFVILTNQPLYIYDVSFLLSFMAGFAIAVINRPVNCLKPSLILAHCKSKWLEKAVERFVRTIIFSLSVNVFLLPVQLLFFCTFSPYSFIANVLLLVFMPVVISGGMIIPVLYYIFCGVRILAIPIEAILNLFERVCQIINGFAGAQIASGILTPVKFVMWLICIICFIGMCSEKRITGVNDFIPLLLTFVIIIPIHGKALKVSFLYAGQGDCCIILKEDKVIMIDCGSSDNDMLYKNTVKPYLNYMGYEKVDYIFVSHGDKDHVSGINEMVSKNKCRDSILFLPKLDDYGKMNASLENKDDEEHFKKIEYLIEGDEITVDDIKITVLSPNEDNNSETDNESSMVLYVTCDRLDMLFMGDLGLDYEKNVISAAQNKNLGKIDIIKIGHHGSRFSTGDELLDYFEPDTAVLSSGIHNMYNHPSPVVLEKLKNKCIDLKITKESGEYFIKYKP